MKNQDGYVRPKINREQSLNLLDSARLYGIVDAGYIAADEYTAVAQELIDAGVTVLQWRAKDVEIIEVERVAHELAQICARGGAHGDVVFIVNDYPEIALCVGADGVHIGQDDGNLAAVREIVGEQLMVGRSTHSAEQAKAALDEGFDYIGFGPLFPTPTKKGRPSIGLEDVSEVENNVGSKIPVFCIGGVKMENLEKVKLAGARRVVVVSDILQASSKSERVGEILAFMHSPA